MVEDGRDRGGQQKKNDVKFIHDLVMRRQLVRTSCELFLSTTKDVLTPQLFLSMYFRFHTKQ